MLVLYSLPLNTYVCCAAHLQTFWTDIYHTIWVCNTHALAGLNSLIVGAGNSSAANAAAKVNATTAVAVAAAQMVATMAKPPGSTRTSSGGKQRRIPVLPFAAQTYAGLTWSSNGTTLLPRNELDIDITGTYVRGSI